MKNQLWKVAHQIAFSESKFHNVALIDEILHWILLNYPGEAVSEERREKKALEY